MSQPPDEPSPTHKRRPRYAGTVLVVLGALAAGCVPGVTHEFGVRASAELARIELSPDGRQVAIGVRVDHYHAPTDLGQFPDGGMPVYTKRTLEVLRYDLMAGGPLVRLASLRRDHGEPSELAYWDSSGIVVARAGRGHAYDVVDAVTGRVRRLPSSMDAAVHRAWVERHPGSSGWSELRRRHVFERYDAFFLWDPVQRRKRHLFDMPVRWDGHRSGPSSPWAPERRREGLRDAVLQVWDVAARMERDSVRLVFDTYAARPSGGARRYDISCQLEAPDTLGRDGRWAQAGWTNLPVETRWLLPTTTRLEVVLGNAELRRRLQPGVERLIWTAGDSARATMIMNLIPRPLPTDSLPVDDYAYHATGGSVDLRLARSGRFRPRWYPSRASLQGKPVGDQDEP